MKMSIASMICLLMPILAGCRHEVEPAPNKSQIEPVFVQEGANYRVNEGLLLEGAVQALRAVQSRSIVSNREYCGYVVYDMELRTLAITPAQSGVLDACSPYLPPPSHKLVASYHTHGATDPNKNSERPSYSDLLADTQDGTIGYLATPNGNLWSIDPRSLTVHLLCENGCINDNDPIASVEIVKSMSFEAIRAMEKKQ